MPTLQDLTPGERTAARGRIGSRPGQADYLEMQIIEICKLLKGHPLARTMFGDQAEVVTSFHRLNGTIRFEIRKAAPTRSK